MATGKVYRLEFFAEGEWRVYGTYSEKFIQQLIAGACELATSGYEPYRSIRVSEVE